MNKWQRGAEKLRQSMDAQRRIIDETLPLYVNKSVAYASGDAGKGREIASAAATIAGILPVRDWAAGMTTQPGDMVYSPQKDYVYIYAGKDPMTHSNTTYYPGASGVYYWAIIPNLHDGVKVYPNISGIIVAVRKDEIWWNPGRTKKCRWNDADNNACSWYPGQAGVNQWIAA